MGILSGTGTEHKKRGHKLVGVNVLPPVFEYLTLYGLAKGKSKSALIATLLDEWKKERAEMYSIQSLRANIIEKIEASFKSQIKLSFEEFKLEVEKTLRGKGLEETHITYILKHLKG